MQIAFLCDLSVRILNGSSKSVSILYLSRMNTIIIMESSWSTQAFLCNLLLANLDFHVRDSRAFIYQGNGMWAAARFRNCQLCEEPSNKVVPFCVNFLFSTSSLHYLQMSVALRDIVIVNYHKKFRVFSATRADKCGGAREKSFLTLLKSSSSW